MMQEGAIKGWLDTIDQKKKTILEKEQEVEDLTAENLALR
jgi:hypothetical protein